MKTVLKTLILCCLVVVMGALVGLCIGVIKFGGYSITVIPSAVLVMIITAYAMWVVATAKR